MNYTSNKDYDVSGRASIITEGVCLGFHHIKCGKDRWGIQRWRGEKASTKGLEGIYKGQLDHSGWSGKGKILKIFNGHLKASLASLDSTVLVSRSLWKCSCPEFRFLNLLSPILLLDISAPHSKLPLRDPRTPSKAGPTPAPL